MQNSWNRRDVIGLSGAAALAAAVDMGAPAFAAAQANESTASSSNPERNKRWLSEQRAAAQMRALPSALPGEEKNFDAKATSLGSGSAPKRSMHSNDSPITPGMSAEDRARIQGGFASQALGPTFLSFGPMMAEGDYVVEEWESQIYGANRTLYNNQYLTVRRFEGDQVALSHQYNDSHHAAITFGPLGNWPEIKPPTNPRRRNHDGRTPPPLPPAEIETVFDVTDRLEIEPRMLRDVVPSASARPVKIKPGVEGNKALVLALRKARASGDQAAVNSFYAKGFRHFIAGERPFGWDHLPLEKIYAPLVAHATSPLTTIYGPLVAEGDHVFEQMDSFAKLDDGTVYNNWHAFVHEIRNGKIVQTREYLDTLHVWVVLGRWADWGHTPVPPRSSPRRSNLQGIASTIQYPTTFGPDLERWRPFTS
jgi:uncharacterized protein